MDVIGSKLNVSEWPEQNLLVGWSGLTSHSDSLPTHSFPSQLAGTPNDGSQFPWWCPTSRPHCEFPEMPVQSVFSNISSSKLAKQSLSMSTSLRINGTLVSCASQAFWSISVLLYVLNMGFLVIRYAMKRVWAWAIGNEPNQAIQTFLFWLTWASNQLAIWALSTIERVPTWGTRVFSKSLPSSSSHFLAGTTLLEVLELELFGAVSSVHKTPMCD